MFGTYFQMVNRFATSKYASLLSALSREKKIGSLEMGACGIDLTKARVLHKDIYGLGLSSEVHFSRHQRKNGHPGVAL